MRIRTVSWGNDFGLFGRWTFGTDNEQDTSQATASFCLSMLFEELFRNISFFHRFLPPEKHSCQKVGVTERFDQMDVAAAFAFVVSWSCPVLEIDVFPGNGTFEDVERGAVKICTYTIILQHY